MLERQLRPAQDFIENAHIEVQGLGPWRGLGSALTLLAAVNGSRAGYNSPAAPIPRSGFVLGWKCVIPIPPFKSGH